MAQIRMTVLLNSKTDADLLAWLKTQKNFSQVVRQALRDKMAGRVSAPSQPLPKGGITLDDIYAELQEIRRCGIVVQGGASRPDTSEEPPDIAANLDRLGL